MGANTAWALMNTCLAAMVTGHSIPPARLHTLKTAMHHSYAGELMCQDENCINRDRGCKGNR